MMDLLVLLWSPTSGARLASVSYYTNIYHKDKHIEQINVTSTVG